MRVFGMTYDTSTSKTYKSTSTSDESTNDTFQCLTSSSKVSLAKYEQFFFRFHHCYSNYQSSSSWFEKRLLSSYILIKNVHL